MEQLNEGGEVTTRSNIIVHSNIMIDDGQHVPYYRYMPGDLVVQLHPEWADKRIMRIMLTPVQVEEFRQQLVCLKCGRPCAGTCEDRD